MNITIIGGGPGGYEAAIYASRLGAQVTLVEKNALGGTCLNVGCIPTKSLLACREVLETVRGAEPYGISLQGGARPNMDEIISRKDTVVKGLIKGVEYILHNSGVTIVRGHGKLLDGHTVEVALTEGGVEVIPSDAIILATGSVPSVPGFLKADGSRVVTSDEILSQRELAQSVLILGGGVIGCEIGQFLSGMGTQVSILEMMPHLLPHEDEEPAKLLQRKFRKENISVLCGATVVSVQAQEAGVLVRLSDEREISAAQLLVAVGRSPYTVGLGLECAGISTDAKGFVPVDANLRTSAASVFAIGDIIATPQLAHVATKEGLAAVDCIMGAPAPMKYHAVPRCVYTNPEIASVGMTEVQLKSSGTAYRKGSVPFSSNGKAKAGGHTDGFVNVFVDENDVLLGACIVGAHATEMLPVLTLAVEIGLTAKQVGGSIFAHPTMSEAIMAALHTLPAPGTHKRNV